MTYLGCLLDETLSGESMALKVINKINSRLRFLYRKNRFLSPRLRRLLCNSLIQPHFDYACSAWYPNLNKRLKSKLQILQNKCIRFGLNLNNRAHIGRNEFEQINWLPVNDRFKQERRTNHGQNNISYIAPIIWNNLLNSLKTTGNLNAYKHRVKEHFFSPNKK